MALHKVAWSKLTSSSIMSADSTQLLTHGVRYMLWFNVIRELMSSKTVHVAVAILLSSIHAFDKDGYMVYTVKVGITKGPWPAPISWSIPSFPLIMGGVCIASGQRLYAICLFVFQVGLKGCPFAFQIERKTCPTLPQSQPWGHVLFLKSHGPRRVHSAVCILK